MAQVPRDTIRRVGRTTEWFIVEQIAKNVAPSERFFLLYEMRGRRATDVRCARARRDHPVGRCIDEFILVTVTRAQLEAVLGEPAWLAGAIASDVARAGELGMHEALCIAICDDDSEPVLIRLAARAVNRRDATPPLIER